jgi:hypothetical protein
MGWITAWKARAATAAALVWLLLALAGCRGPAVSADISLPAVLPGDGIALGWQTSNAPKIYTQDQLYQLVDGQADAFFAYGFQQVIVQRYNTTDGSALNLEVWQLAQAADACGLYLSNQSGKAATIAGVESRLDSGRRVSFWQDRYYAAITASQTVPDETLTSFARYVAGKLPTGGSRPSILSALPASGMTADSALFFHLEISIQNDVWLGGKNILGLSDQTSGALARYTLNEKKAVLVLIDYPAADAAQKGLEALQAAKPKKLLASSATGSRLSAVFGEASAADAQALLESVK